MAFKLEAAVALVRRPAALRARTPALQGGAQRTLEAGSEVFAWLREGGGPNGLPLGPSEAVLLRLHQDR
jgi:hypothetical protein